MIRKKPLAQAAVKKLGLRVDEQLKQSFLGNGTIAFDYYQMFWLQLGSPGGTTEFMPLILSRLILELERKVAGPPKGKEKEEKDPADAPLSPVLLQGLVNTIMFTTLYLKFNPKEKAIQKHLERWAELDKTKKISGLLPSAAEVIRVLGVMKEETTAIPALNTIVMSCSTLRTGKEFQDLERCACVDDRTVPDAESCFFFSYLRAAIVDDASRMAILQATYAKLLTAGKMLTQPALAETTLLAAGFMLKQFIASGPITDAQFLRKALTSLRPFYLWPKPFGTCTRELLQTLKEELICPGSLFRSQFDVEAKIAHYRPVKKNGEYGREVYYFWEVDHPESKTRATVMELRPRKPNEKKKWDTQSVIKLDPNLTPRLGGATQALLMLNLLAEEKDVGATDADAEHFSKLSEAQIGTLYSKFQDITNALRGHSLDKVAAVRVAELKKFKAEVTALAAKGTAGATPLPKDIKSPFLPELPPLVHTSIETAGGLKQETKDELGLMCLKYIPYPSSDIEEHLESIFANYVTVQKPISMRFVIAGGNKLLHSFLCSYMRVNQLHPEWVKDVNIQLFVAPWSPNDLCNFIARHDPWYNRHVYVPSRTPLLVLPFSNPTDALFEPDDTEDAAPVEKPGQFLREIMSSYVRSAQHTLNVNVYLMEGWFAPLPVKSDKDKTEKKQQKDKEIDVMADSIVPFVGRVLIGEEADKQQAEKRAKNAKFTYNPEDLVVRFSRMDLAGNTFATQSEDPLAYQTITIANLPVADDVCYASDPSVPWLEMHALASKKADVTKVGARNLLLTDAQQHIDFVEISCTGPNQSFSCLVDGVLFGPFHHIKVSRCRNTVAKNADPELGEPMVLPIATFFPINV